MNDTTFLFFLSLLSLSLISSKTIENIDLPYKKLDLITSSDRESLFKVNLSNVQYTYIQIRTTPILSNEVVNFFISYTNESPTYTNSNYRTHALGDNIFFLKKFQSEFFYLRIESLTPETSYSLSLTPITSQIPSLYQDEHIFSDISKLSQLNIKYSPYGSKPQLPRYIMIYALGYNKEDFSIKVTHKCSDESEKEETVNQVFYSGYGALIDLIDSDEYKGNDECMFEVTLEQISNSGIIKMGSFMPYDTEDTIFLFDDPQDHYVYLSFTKSHQCYNLYFDQHENPEKYIINAMTYPYHTIKISLVRKVEGKTEFLSVFENKEDTSSSSFIFELDNKAQQLCFTSFDLSTYPISVIFSITPYNDAERYQMYRNPLINGFVLNAITKQGDVTSFRKGRFIDKFDTERVLLHIQSGKIDLIGYNCKEFPCSISSADFDDIKARHLGTFSYQVSDSYILTHPLSTEQSPDSPNKFLYLVKCNQGDCSYSITVTLDDSDIIELEPEIIIHNYISPGRTTKYDYINMDNAMNAIAFEVESVTGSVKANIVHSLGIAHIKHKYIGNKEINIVQKPADKDITGQYVVQITSKENSYYTIKVIKSFNDKNEFAISSNMVTANYVTENNPKKVFILKNYCHYNHCTLPFLITVYPLNCALKYTFNGQTREIVESDGFSIDTSDPIYTNETFTIEVNYQKSDDFLLKNTEACIFYISGSEGSTLNPLVLNEASEVKNIFLKNKSSAYHYKYPLVYSVKDKDMIVSIRFEGTQNLKLTIIVNTNDKFVYNIYKESDLYLNDEIKNCANGLNCDIELILEVNQWIDEIFEYTLRVTGNRMVPLYIRENKLLKDVIPSNYHHFYYTDIEESEEGNLYVNFIKGGGRVFARLVPKLFTEYKANWHNHLMLPYFFSNQDELVDIEYPYNVVQIKKEKSSICLYGCELYIGVQKSYSNGVGELAEFSIYFRKNNNKMMFILPNTYISGILSNRNDSQKFKIGLVNYIDNAYYIMQSTYGEMYIMKGIESTVSRKKFDAKSETPSTVISLSNEMKEEEPQYASAALYVSKITQTRKSEYFLFKVLSGKRGSMFNFISQENGELCEFDAKDAKCLLILPIKYYETARTVSLHIKNIDSNYNAKYEIYSTVIKEEEFASYTYLPDNLIPSKDNYKYTSINQHRNDTIYIPYDSLYEGCTIYVMFAIYSNEANVAKVLASSKELMSSLLLGLDYVTLFYFNRTYYKRTYLTVNSKNDISYAKFHILHGEGLLKYNDNEMKLKGDVVSLEISKKAMSIEPISDEFIMYTEFDTDITSHKNPDKFNSIDYGKNLLFAYNQSEGVDFPHIFYMQCEHRENEYMNVEFIIKEISASDMNIELIGYIASEDFMNLKKYDHNLAPSKEYAVYKGKFDSILQRGFVGVPIKQKDTKDYVIIEMIKKSEEKYQTMTYSVNSYPSMYNTKNTLDISKGEYHHFSLNNENNYTNVLKLSSTEDNFNYHIEISAMSNMTIAIKEWNDALDISNMNNETSFDISSEYSYGRHSIEVYAKKSLCLLIKAIKDSDYYVKYYVNKESGREASMIFSDVKVNLKSKGNNTYDITTNFTFLPKPKKGYFFISIYNADEISKEKINSIYIDTTVAISAQRIPIADNILTYSSNLQNITSKSNKFYMSLIASFYNETLNTNLILAYPPIAISSSHLFLYIILAVSLSIVLIIIIIIVVKCAKKNRRKLTTEELLLQKSINTESMLGPVI